jgi:hypothetical protein
MPSFIPIYDRTKVMPGMAQIYLAPYSVASPAVLPADTVALGGTWPASPQPWTPIGATEDGVTMAFRRNTTDQMIEEQMTPVGVETADADLRYECSLSEDTLETMRIAFGGGTVTTTAAATGQIGKKVLVLSTDLDHFALGFEAKNPDGFFRRMLIPDIVSIADISTPFRRAAGPRRYRVAFRALVAPEAVTIVNKTANALP